MNSQKYTQRILKIQFKRNQSKEHPQVMTLELLASTFMRKDEKPDNYDYS